MPTLTRWFVKSSLVYFVAALIVAIALAAQSALPLPPAVGSWMPVLVAWAKCSAMSRLRYDLQAFDGKLDLDRTERNTLAG